MAADAGRPPALFSVALGPARLHSAFDGSYTSHNRSSFNAFYVKANGKATVDAVRQGFDQLAVEQYRDFIGVQLPGAPKKTPEEMLSRLSVMFSTDVIWLSFESARTV